MVKNRVSMKVDAEFEQRIKKIKKKIMLMRGEKISDREITKQIIKSPSFQAVENQLINNNIPQLNFNIKFDRRII